MFSNFVGVVTSVIIFKNNPPYFSSPSAFLTAQQVVSQSCSTALIAGKSRLKGVKGIQNIRVQHYDISQMYPDHPIGRSQGYLFAMKGSGVDIVMASPKFMTSIAYPILKNCETLGKVEFGLDNSGWGKSVGLLEDERIDIFKCLEHPGIRASGGKGISWGEEYCSL